jgi:hypothetical protein
MSLHDNASLKSLVDLWLQLDKVSKSLCLLVGFLTVWAQNPATRQEIQVLWDGGRLEELEKRMR